MLVCKSLQSRGDSSRKLSPFFVETASHHKGVTRQHKSATSHHKGAIVIHFETATHITRVPLDSTVTAQECHPHQKGARSHHKGARSHKKGAIVIHFFRCPFRGYGENVSEMMMMMVMIVQSVGPNQIMRCFLIALTSSTVDMLRLLLHFLTTSNCSRKVCEIEP